MIRFPYFSFPGSYYRRYNYYPNYNQVIDNSTAYHVPNNDNYIKQIDTNRNNSQNNEKDNLDKQNSKDETFLFDIFGLKIYLDDVIIVALLFFLYQEEVQDEGLFIALILLLLT